MAGSIVKDSKSIGETSLKYLEALHASKYYDSVEVFVGKDRNFINFMDRTILTIKRHTFDGLARFAEEDASNLMKELEEALYSKFGEFPQDSIEAANIQTTLNIIRGIDPDKVRLHAVGVMNLARQHCTTGGVKKLGKLSVEEMMDAYQKFNHGDADDAIIIRDLLESVGFALVFDSVQQSEKLDVIDAMRINAEKLSRLRRD